MQTPKNESYNHQLVQLKSERELTVPTLSKLTGISENTIKSWLAKPESVKYRNLCRYEYLFIKSRILFKTCIGSENQRLESTHLVVLIESTLASLKNKILQNERVDQDCLDMINHSLDAIELISNRLNDLVPYDTDELAQYHQLGKVLDDFSDLKDKRNELSLMDEHYLLFDSPLKRLGERNES